MLKLEMRMELGGFQNMDGVGTGRILKVRIGEGLTSHAECGICIELKKT